MVREFGWRDAAACAVWGMLGGVLALLVMMRALGAMEPDSGPVKLEWPTKIERPTPGPWPTPCPEDRRETTA